MLLQPTSAAIGRLPERRRVAATSKNGSVEAYKDCACTCSLAIVLRRSYVMVNSINIYGVRVRLDNLSPSIGDMQMSTSVIGQHVSTSPDPRNARVCMCV